MLILQHGNLTIESTGRLVKRAEVQAIADATAIINAAQEEADGIRRLAQEEFEKQKQLGFEKGLDDGKLEIIMQKFEQVEKSIDYMESMENNVVNIVLEALKKCVEEIGDRELMIQIIRKAMQAVVRNQHTISLKVPPDMLSTVKGRMQDILSHFPGVNYLEVTEDSKLSGVSCRLDTDAGSVDASLEVQLAAIDRALNKCFKRS